MFSGELDKFLEFPCKFKIFLNVNIYSLMSQYAKENKKIFSSIECDRVWGSQDTYLTTC